LDYKTTCSRHAKHTKWRRKKETIATKTFNCLSIVKKNIEGLSFLNEPGFLCFF